MPAKIEIVQGDITEIECDAIVNAANTSLLGGGGVDGVIHRKAGPDLLQECKSLGGCPVGECRITSGYNLKANYVIHAVGPVWQGGQNGEREKLISTYQNSLKLASDHEIGSMAFPNISTGIFRFPRLEAAKIAIDTVRKHMEQHGILKVYFACFEEVNYRIYKELVD